MSSSIIYILKVILFAYVLLLAYLFFFQRSQMYHPDRSLRSPAFYGVAMEELSLTTSDGVKLTAWFKAPADPAQPVVLFFHGNAGNLGGRDDIFNAFLRRGFGVFGLSYRGYGSSEGSPTEPGLYDDARTALAKLAALGFAPENIVLFGESLGSGVAVQMATEFKVRALVLESPFENIASRAQELYPYFPVTWMLWDKFDSESKIKNISVPVLILHGDEDRVMPLHHGKALFEAANEPKKMVIFPGTGHSDFPSHKVVGEVESFLKAFK